MEQGSEYDYNEIARCLSADRIKPCERLVGLPFVASSIVVYDMLQLQQSLFFLPLQYLEICLRNRIDESLSSYYSSISCRTKLPGLAKEWYLWMPEANKTKVAVLEAYDRAKSEVKGRALKSGDVIGRMNFGIWRHVLKERADNKDRFHFWRAVVKEIFPNAPCRKEGILQRLGGLTVIRNRLFHYEPLWKTGATAVSIEDALSEMRRKYDLIMEFIGWMSLALKKFVSSNDSMYDEISSRVKETALRMAENISSNGYLALY